MVLQRDTPLRIWGWAEPGQTVTVTLGNQTSEAATAPTGKWEAHLDAIDAGGPFTMEIASNGETLTFENILIGDVWVCSGQSNMFWPVADSSNPAEEIAAANFPNIRLFRVPRKASGEPLADVDSHWTECSPESVARFSAVAYHFGRELFESNKIPIGLIQSSVGGTTIEPWMSPEGLDAHPVLRPLLEQSELATMDFASAYQKYLQRAVDWEKNTITENPNRNTAAKGWSAPEFDDSDWQTIKLPEFWEKHGLMMDGVVWFRRTITIPTNWANRQLSLSLGRIDDYDETFLHGVLVGQTDNQMESPSTVLREYQIPPEAVRAGENVIAVRVTDIRGNGGFPGPADAMALAPTDGADGEVIALAGEWRYHVELEIDYGQFDQAPGIPSQAGSGRLVSELYNGMIAPLTKYRIRGVIWYQGESNTGRADIYRTTFPTLIGGWRRAWDQGDFPFLFVQLANLTRHTPDKRDPVVTPSDANTHSGWAELREAQMLTLDVPKTAMVVTMDIGDSFDIHPGNKRDVGKRLALAARHVAGGEDVLFSGPIYQSHESDNGKIRISFNHVGGGLVARGGPLASFAVAGSDGQFFPAKAEIAGDTVVVWHDQVAAPVAVRYLWGNDPVAGNLFNKGGLPASPFRTDGPEAVQSAPLR